MKFNDAYKIYLSLINGREVSVTRSDGRSYDLKITSENGASVFCRTFGKTTRKYKDWVKLLDSFSRVEITSVTFK